jgi:hypothetical protein
MIYWGVVKKQIKDRPGAVGAGAVNHFVEIEAHGKNCRKNFHFSVG